MLLFIKVKNKLRYEFRKLLAAYHAKKVLIPFDERWFRNKRVAIIGGADSALQEKLGEYIDNFDVVVRINKGVEVVEGQQEYIGTKTDILFHCFYVRDNDIGSSPITVDLWKKKEVGQVIYSHNYRCSAYSLKNFMYCLKATQGQLSFAQVPETLFDANLDVTRPYGPTTGLIVINTVFNCHPKELYITGITFFKTPHNQDYRKGEIESYHQVFDKYKSHDPEREYQHVKKLYLEAPHIIKPDKTLQAIFETN